MVPQEKQEHPDRGREGKPAPVTVRTLLNSRSGPRKVLPSVTVKRKALPIPPHALAADMVQTLQENSVARFYYYQQPGQPIMFYLMEF